MYRGQNPAGNEELGIYLLVFYRFQDLIQLKWGLPADRCQSDPTSIGVNERVPLTCVRPTCRSKMNGNLLDQ